ncbi:MAG: ferrochelatase [Thermodesulfovibrionales bacterium]|nr:ferrochelatase [Thermodesulfovibrionales bacterium]
MNKTQMVHSSQFTVHSDTIGVVLLNLGGPDSLQAVRPFLYNLFSDRKIIQLGPPFLQKTIARLIAMLRSKKTESYYRLIGGRSPILDITNAQAKALEETLNQFSVQGSASENSELLTPNSEKSPHPPFVKGGRGGIKVFVGMRYWHPLIEDVIPQIYNDGIRRLIALSLYPQYSLATSGSSLSKFREVATKYSMEVFCTPSWYDHPLYIEALVDVIKKGLKSFDSELNVHVLFSAHSLPEKFIDEGDPYVRHIERTIEEIVKRMPVKWHLSYQSKSGPVKWLGPSTDEKLKELADRNIKNILIVPISFVSDHIETLYEIDILYMQMAKDLGINLRRTDSLNTHPLFIEALKDIVIKNMKELGWTE